MTLYPQQYDLIRFYVESNARLQASEDSKSFPSHRIKDTIDDPSTLVNALQVLEAWKHGRNADLVFTQAPMQYVSKLSTNQRKQLIDIWVGLYAQVIMQLLRHRYERELV